MNGECGYKVERGDGKVKKFADLEQGVDGTENLTVFHSFPRVTYCVGHPIVYNQTNSFVLVPLLPHYIIK